MNKGFFTDELGNPSMARLISFIVMLAGIIIALATSAGIIFGKVGLTGGITLISMCFGLITGGITQKSVSKSAELSRFKNTEIR